MKIKKLIYIILILLILPVPSPAEEYPYLPTSLKEDVISFFNINTAGKTMLYERVTIYDDFDAWMIGWFDSECKIIAGITDTEDIIYYSMSRFDEDLPTGQTITPEKGEEIARGFLMRVMPRTAITLVSSDAYEYTYSQTHNGIRLLGRDATVVVDKMTGQVVYYKGFGVHESNFELMEQLITPEHAFENYYENIGLELVYNTVFDHETRIKRIRPMYILNRSELSAINAQTGETAQIVMNDYNYYYSDGFYDERYYYNNNIYSEEKLFEADGRVSASGYDISEIFKMGQLGLSDKYSGKITPGNLRFYSDGEGNDSSVPVLRIDIVPMNQAVNVLKFSEMFDSGNGDLLSQAECETPFSFVRAYVNAKNGQLIDYETVKNVNYLSKLKPYFSRQTTDKFIKAVAGDLPLKYHGMLKTGDNEYTIVYARYADGIRVIGEGVELVYDAALRAVTDYSLILSDIKLFPASFMKTPEEIKETVKKELKLELFYVDKDRETKFVVYDSADKNIAFDPVTGERTDRLKWGGNSFIGSCSPGSSEYMLNGIAATGTPPTIYSDKLCLPVDVIAPALGYTVTTGESEIFLEGHKDSIKLTENSKVCYVNGVELMLDLEPVRISDKIYISAGNLRTLFGMFLSWDTETDKIHLIK
ncbi:MAG: hypothetical protein IKT39_01160 [Clostridia bacterium]|nr:hypothetical protein [Clostridia bacterium]